MVDVINPYSPTLPVDALVHPVVFERGCSGCSGLGRKCPEKERFASRQQRLVSGPLNFIKGIFDGESGHVTNNRHQVIPSHQVATDIIDPRSPILRVRHRLDQGRPGVLLTGHMAPEVWTV